MSEFSKRVILITGATGGLGDPVTKMFLDAGAMVAGVWSTSKPLDLQASRFMGVQADLTTAAGARSAVEQVLKEAKRIDGLLHLLGGFAGGKPVAETDDETWDRMMRLNLNAAFYTMRAVLPHMLKARQGRIVAIGSRTGVEPVAALSAYGASKAGLIALVRTIAAEVKDAGITANVVLPSVIDTPANRQAFPNADFSKWVKPEAIANLLLWLASDAAADVNGAVIPIYGVA
jgi:NAD(P)-dependent dehydrogenase (short-subunit alcohol dehydrogenase family)